MTLKMVQDYNSANNFNASNSCFSQLDLVNDAKPKENLGNNTFARGADMAVNDGTRPTETSWQDVLPFQYSIFCCLIVVNTFISHLFQIFSDCKVIAFKTKIKIFINFKNCSVSVLRYFIIIHQRVISLRTFRFHVSFVLLLLWHQTWRRQAKFW